MFNNTHILCTNCGVQGHTSKFCPQPIVSFGAILFRIHGADPWNQAEELLHGRGVEGEHPPAAAIQYLLIQRRDSIGFVEMMRGKYRLQDTPYIQQQLAGTTKEERRRLCEEPFDSLWESLWGPPQETGHAYRSEKEQARTKLEALRMGSPSLLSLCSELDTHWETPEWGFPKGRRDPNESEYACAMRELWEETNIKERDIVPLRSLEPFVETFQGSNKVFYSHKYFIAYVPPGAGEDAFEVAHAANMHIRREVGDYGWFSFEEALQKIRPGNAEKRAVLTRVHDLLQRYSPLRLGSSAL